MTGRLHALRVRHTGRPLLMTSAAAMTIAEQLRGVDPQAFARPNRLGALLSLLGRRKDAASANPVRQAMEDDYDGPAPVPFEQRAAYAPLYAGEPDDLGYCWALNSGVAMLQVDTPLLERGEDFCGIVYHGYDTLLAALRDSDADDRVKARFVRMACPGGIVAGGMAALAAYMRENRGSTGGKPIWVYADMACSAAYWIAAQADRILAPSVGLVGSIGAVIVHEDWSAALDKAGLAIESIQFGAQKTDGAWWKALDPAAREDLQAEIDECGLNFVADVVAGRPAFTAEALIATRARVFMAENRDQSRSGLALGFVDEICSEEAAFAALVASVSAPQAPETPASGAAGGRSASKPAKEQPMAHPAPTPKGASAALQAALAAKRAADATLAQIRAEEAAASPPAKDPEDGEDALDGGADEASEGEDPDEDKKEKSAAAIAASPEAKTHQGLALAAIASGMSLSQFKASVAAAGPSASAGKLAPAFAGAPRVAADATPSRSGDGKMANARDTYARNREAGLKRR